MPIASSKSSNSIMEGNDITKSGLHLVEKKVRNLEKRKLKLDAYKKQMDDGKKLNEDQMNAIANLAVVEVNLEMAKDLLKQFQQLCTEHQKQMKKQARREQAASQAARHNNDVAKVTEVLELQSLMDNLSEDVRADFINGTNRAAVVTEEEFNQIDKFYKLITPDDEGDEKMSQQIKDASKHIVSFLEKSSAAVADTTYKALYELVSRIKKCGYFDPDKTSEEAGNEEEEEQGSSRASTPNGELSATSGEEAQETATQPQQETVTESALPAVPADQKDQETIPPQDIPQEVAPPTVADVTAVTANEHGLNFLGDSEIEKAASPPESNIPAPQGVSDWAEEVENGPHPGEAQTGDEHVQPATNGFGHRGGRGGGRGGGYRGNFNRRGGGGDRGGPRRGGRGGFGPSRGGGFQDGDGYRRGGRGGRGFSRGGGPRGGRRGGPPPQ